MDGTLTVFLSMCRFRILVVLLSSHSLFWLFFSDETKVTCGINHLKEGCVVYSIGGNNQWMFELDVLKNTPCEVHTFDCTGPIERFEKPNQDRLHFHHVCLGTTHEPKPDVCHHGKCGETWTLAEIQKTLGHATIDLFKMDIEGWEWDFLDSWPELNSTQADQLLLPNQILLEFHYWVSGLACHERIMFMLPI
jgi:hypothetical protein